MVTLTVPAVAAGIVSILHVDPVVTGSDIIHAVFAAAADAENDMEEIHDSDLRIFAAAQAGEILFHIHSSALIAGPLSIHYTIHTPP